MDLNLYQRVNIFSWLAAWGMWIQEITPPPPSYPATSGVAIENKGDVLIVERGGRERVIVPY